LPTNASDPDVAGLATATHASWALQEIWGTVPTCGGSATCCQLVPPLVVSAIPSPLTEQTLADTQLVDVQADGFGAVAGSKLGNGTNDQCAPPSIEWSSTLSSLTVSPSTGPAQQLSTSGHEILGAGTASVTP
jgi:hypothetical protein